MKIIALALLIIAAVIYSKDFSKDSKPKYIINNSYEYSSTPMVDKYGDVIGEINSITKI